MNAIIPITIIDWDWQLQDGFFEPIPDIGVHCIFIELDPEEENDESVSERG